jgi:hypothetical protein
LGKYKYVSFIMENEGCKTATTEVEEFCLLGYTAV